MKIGPGYAAQGPVMLRAAAPLTRPRWPQHIHHHLGGHGGEDGPDPDRIVDGAFDRACGDRVNRVVRTVPP